MNKSQGHRTARPERVLIETGYSKEIGGRHVRLALCSDGKEQPQAVFVVGAASAICPRCDEEHETLSIMDAYKAGWLSVDPNSDSTTVIGFEGSDLFLQELDALTQKPALRVAR